VFGDEPVRLEVTLYGYDDFLEQWLQIFLSVNGSPTKYDIPA
jgi:D-lyxose ketol-isomerase